MEKAYWAHSLAGAEVEKWQRLSDHLAQVARLAERYAGSFNAGRWGYIAGMCHDMGKYSEPFQEKITASAAPDEASAAEAANRRVDHSTAGGRHLARLWPLEGKILSYTVMGHHGGLPDGKRPDGSDLHKRLDETRQVPDVSHAFSRIVLPGEKPQIPFTAENGRIPFQLSFFIRMLFSCLVDADFLDTESFLSPETGKIREKPPSIQSLKEPLFKKLAAFRADSPVNVRRAQILNDCIQAASGPPGLYTLTVPTGGGKTLSSLAFAVEHALVHKKERIIYVIPFTSIIEQNAAIFREILPEGAVLEHHANFSGDNRENSDDTMDESALRHRLATENWDTPVVVTTNVQFFESLFSNRTSKTRKLHNIANSVVILDEAQMLPEPYLMPCIETIRELSLNYNTTVVLCTATQPALTRSEEFPQGLPKKKDMEIIPDPLELHEHFKRVRLTSEGEISDRELIERIREESRILCIVNTRNRAAGLFESIMEIEGAFHLSARMCPVHRVRVLDKIRARLKENSPCRVISTQLVEAGVDIDFPVVYREMAGLDSIAQAAGRCNREGRLQAGTVVVFTPEGGKIPRTFRKAARAAQEVLERHDDPFCPDAMEQYFRQVYWLAGERLDAKGILEDLKEGADSLDFPFRRIAEKFRLIETEMKTVAVPFDKTAEALIEKLHYSPAPGPILRRLQPYGVQIYDKEFNNIRSEGGIEMVHGQYPVLVSLIPFYDSRLGIRQNDLKLQASSLII